MDKLSTPPFLLLSAPKIAGYLPARVDPPPEPPRSDSFIYRDARLKTLPPAKYDAILSSAFDLLTVMVGVAVGEEPPSALLAAERSLYETVVYGQAAPRVDPMADTYEHLATIARTYQEKIATARIEGARRVEAINQEIERRYQEKLRQMKAQASQ